jgi:hypothetical protein
LFVLLFVLVIEGESGLKIDHEQEHEHDYGIGIAR